MIINRDINNHKKKNTFEEKCVQTYIIISSV